MKKKVLWFLGILVVLHLIFFATFYFVQESFIFPPTKLSKEYIYSFDQNYEEINIQSSDGKSMNSLLFRSDSTKGLVFFLHGNAGALDSWGGLASNYTDTGYDIFMIDYRGYGKSEGEIDSKMQLFDDLQHAYNEMKKRYDENKIIIVGFSIGTGPAAYLAAENNPHSLVLLAPYYSLPDLMQDYCPILPRFLIKYKIDTYQYIEKSSVPTYIFHGDEDKTINYHHSVKLGEKLTRNDKLAILKGENHSRIIRNIIYLEKLNQLLNNNE